MALTVRVQGGPRQRGQMYGDQAREQVALSIAAYRDLFAHYAGWDWRTVTEHAAQFEEPIAAFGAKYVEELRGIAEGADVPFEDVLAINVRTEVMFAAKARAAATTLPGRGECTSFAVLPRLGSGDPVLVGQNWDWMLHAQDTVVVVEAEQDDAPSYVTVVEGGLLAKTGLNSAGLGVVTNALVCADDRGEPGVPYHVLLRALLDARTPGQALATLQRSPRSSSANYLVGHRSGLALNVEAAPGDFSRLFLTQPDAGRLVHGNHFEHPRFDRSDVGVWLMPDSPFRVQRTRALLHDPALRVTPQSLFSVLGDHAGAPSSVCCHPDPTEHALDQTVTVLSAVMDLEDPTLWLAHGSPCSTIPQELRYPELLQG